MQVQEPTQTLIRKVRAIIEVPVKEESVENDPLEPSDSRSASIGVGSSHSRRSAGKRRAAVDGQVLRRRLQQIGSDEGLDMNNSEDEKSDSETLAYTRRSRRVEDDEDEDEDELMMRAEDDQSKVFVSELNVVTPSPRAVHRAQTQPSVSKHRSTGKRQINSPHPANITKKSRKH